VLEETGPQILLKLKAQMVAIRFLQLQLPQVAAVEVGITPEIETD
jgi:hypothetical protein